MMDKVLPPTGNDQADSPSAGAAKHHILLVDPSEARMDEMRLLLMEAGYPPLSWAKDFATAHSILTLEKIDLVIVAEDIGNDAGIELIWELSSDLLAPPAIMIANKYSRVRWEEAQNLGAKDYLAWTELNPRFLDRTIRTAIAENDSNDAERLNTDDLIQRIFELEHSYHTLEEQAGENAHLAEQLDITRSELEDALSQVVRTKEELEVLNDQKTKLFSIIAHDLRSPLTSLLTLGEMIDLMGDSMSREELIDHISGMSGNVRIVYSLLENLLEWARIQMDQVAFDPCILDLHELASRTTELLSPVGTQKSVTVTNEVPEGLQGYGDLNMIDTIIRNLTNNSIKFTPENGSVTISGSQNDGTAIVRIHDTGVGIPPDRLETLFVLDKGATTKGTKGEKGSGLGLILCRDMVVKNGGEIWAESEEGNGSTFSFTLPVKEF